MHGATMKIANGNFEERTFQYKDLCIPRKSAYKLKTEKKPRNIGNYLPINRSSYYGRNIS